MIEKEQVQIKEVKAKEEKMTNKVKVNKKVEVLRLLKEGKWTTKDICSKAEVSEYYFRSICLGIRQFSDSFKLEQVSYWKLSKKEDATEEETSEEETA